MKKTFAIFAIEEYNSFCAFVNGLTKQKKKFTVTPWLKSKTQNGGFVVHYYY